MAWRQVARKTVYDSPFMKLHEDVIELDNGTVIDDFSVVEFRDGVAIVATDTNGKLIAVDEYKYAVNKTLRTLPGGGIEGDDTPEATAIKELREETGYIGDSAELIGQFYEYPSKLPHTTYVVRVLNAVKAQNTAHEVTEVISEVRLMDFSEESVDQFKTSLNATALYLALKNK